MMDSNNILITNFLELSPPRLKSNSLNNKNSNCATTSKIGQNSNLQKFNASTFNN